MSVYRTIGPLVLELNTIAAAQTELQCMCAFSLAIEMVKNLYMTWFAL